MNKEKRNTIYRAWVDMRNRCYNIKDSEYKRYGERGITVCDEWLNSFDRFYNDMHNTWEKGLSIDRKDNDKNYTKPNCRWATRETQNRNTRKIRSNNTSGYRGVSFKKDRNKWSAYIKINNKKKSLGSYSTALEAAKAYDLYVIENNLEHTLNVVT